LGGVGAEFEPAEFEPADDEPAEDPCWLDPPPVYWLDGESAVGSVAALPRPGGRSGGGTGGWPLIISGPLALFSSVDQPPLPNVAPILHDTCRLPADQLGSDTVL